MEIYTMNYVLAVADLGNFSLAPQAGHVGQPALSQQIAKLERELGITLFYRNSRGATLTEAGKEFVIRAREIIRRTEALEAEMAFYAGLHKGSLTLGIITSLQCIDFGDMLSSFCYNYPDISVNILQDGTHRLVDLLLERKIDLGFLNSGLTESSPVISMCEVKGNHPSTVGKPLIGIEARLGELDELQVRGPQVMKGYWNREEAKILISPARSRSEGRCT